MKNMNMSNSQWNSTNLNSTYWNSSSQWNNTSWNSTFYVPNYTVPLLNINLNGYTIQASLFTDIDYSMHDILWVDFVPYLVNGIVNYTTKPDIWTTLNETGLSKAYDTNSYWTLDMYPKNATATNQSN